MRERRAPADISAVEVNLIEPHDRDNVCDAGGVFVSHGCAEEDSRCGCSWPPSGRVDAHGCVNAFGEKANPRIDLGEASFAVMVVGVFTAVPVTGRPRYNVHHSWPLSS